MRAASLKFAVFLSTAMFSAALAENVDVDGFSSFVAPLQPAFPIGADGRPLANSAAAGEAGTQKSGEEPKFKSFIEPLSPAFRVTDDGKLAEKAPPDTPVSTETPKTSMQADKTTVAQTSTYGWQLPHDDLVGVRLGMDFEKGVDKLFARSDDWMDLAKPPATPDMRIAFSPKKNEVAVIVRGRAGDVAAVGRLVADLDIGLSDLQDELSLKYGVAFSAQANTIDGLDEVRPFGSPVCQPVWQEFFEVFGSLASPSQEIAIPFPLPTALGDGRCSSLLVTRTGKIDGRMTLIMWLVAPYNLPQVESTRILGVSKIEF